MITLEMLQNAVYTSAGLSALIVMLTQILKNNFNPNHKKWISHTLAVTASLICSFVVLIVGITWNIGMYAGFNTSSFANWFIWFSDMLAMAGCAMGLYSFDFVKDILEWLRLFPKEPEQVNE